MIWDRLRLTLVWIFLDYKVRGRLRCFVRNNKGITGAVRHALLNWHNGSPKKWKGGSERPVLHASQVNSWTVEYLASIKYEAQLAFKRKSSPGASGRSQPARPWSAARQEPCVKAEGLCHCVQMFPPALLAATKHTYTYTLSHAHNARTSELRWFNTKNKHLHLCINTHTPHFYCTQIPLCILSAQAHHFLVSSIATSTTSELLSAAAAGNNKAGFKWALQGLKHTAKCGKVPLKCSGKELLLTSCNGAASIHYPQVEKSFRTKEGGKKLKTSTFTPSMLCLIILVPHTFEKDFTTNTINSTKNVLPLIPELYAFIDLSAPLGWIHEG